MIIKDNKSQLELFKSKKSHIKYILLLLTSIILLVLFSLSILNLINRETIYLGSTFTEILANSTFLFLGTIFFVDFILFSIYGAFKNLIETNKIVFDKFKKEVNFIRNTKFLRKEFLKKIPFSEISEIKVEQEPDSDYITLSILHKNKKITIDSHYDSEGMDELNNLAENIHNFIGAPLIKCEFEDIYIEEEEDKEKTEAVKEKNKTEKLSGK